MTLNILAELKENFFIDFALLLIIGILGGKAAEVFRLPKATGYILFGILFGSGFLNVLDGEMLKQYAEIKYAAIGNTVLAVVVVSVIFSKLLGEIIVKWASIKAGQTYIEEDHSPHHHLV